MINLFVVSERGFLFVVPPLGGTNEHEAPPEGGTTNIGSAVYFPSAVSEKIALLSGKVFAGGSKFRSQEAKKGSTCLS